jgi:hypothetical protein
LSLRDWAGATPEASGTGSRLTLERRTMNKIVLSLILFCLVGCATPQSSPKQTWSKLGMSNLILELNDKEYKEWYSFHSNGDVSATFGRKEIISPLLYWKARGDILIISDHDKLVIELRLLEVRQNEVLVQRTSGVKATYKVKRK